MPSLKYAPHLSTWLIFTVFLHCLQPCAFARVKILSDHSVFHPVATGISESFTALGIPHTVVGKIAENDSSTYIVFTTNRRTQPGSLPVKYISYNFEQLATNRAWPDVFFNSLRGALQVWEYSLVNVGVLRSRGITNIVYIPYGYSPWMDHAALGSTPWEARSVDWFLTGVHNSVRQAKLAALTQAYGQHPERYTITQRLWHLDLAKAYRSTKIGLNIHFYVGSTILEVHRIVPMIANRVYVLSEQSADIWYDEEYRSMVTFLPRMSNMTDISRILNHTLHDILALPSERVGSELERRRHHLLTCCSYVHYFKRKIAELAIY